MYSAVETIRAIKCGTSVSFDDSTRTFGIATTEQSVGVDTCRCDERCC
jgi:hypothetical protein